MTKVSRSLPPITWQNQFKKDIIDDVRAAIPFEAEKQRTWILENCESPAKPMHERSIAQLSSGQWGALFVNAVCNTIKKVAKERWDILDALIEIETTPELFQTLIGRRTAEDYAFRRNLSSWIKKRNLLATWIQNPFLVIPKNCFIRIHPNHLTT